MIIESFLESEICTILTVMSSLLNQVSFQEKVLFTKHLDTMVKAGIPIPEALDTLFEQARSPYFKKVISVIQKDVQNGQSLAKSLRKHSDVFDEFYTSLIEVAEESGTLEENLDFLAKQMTKDFRLRKKVQGALMYPALVVFAMTIMGGFISFYILPKLVDFFKAFDVDLPWPTKVLLFIATVSKNYGVYIVVGFVVFVIAIRFATTLPKIKPFWHSFLLRIPLVGKIISYSQLAHLGRNLGTMIKSGVPVSHALEITAHTLTNLKFRKDLIKVASSLDKGKTIGSSLKNGGYHEYPPIVYRMIAIGEKTGKLDETLLYLGDFYEDEIDDLSKNLANILEPILLIVIGVAVGFVALAIISPIYELTGSIRR